MITCTNHGGANSSILVSSFVEKYCLSFDLIHSDFDDRKPGVSTCHVTSGPITN